jgi:hypothetical protein
MAKINRFEGYNRPKILHYCHKVISSLDFHTSLSLSDFCTTLLLNSDFRDLSQIFFVSFRLISIVRIFHLFWCHRKYYCFSSIYLQNYQQTIIYRLSLSNYFKTLTIFLNLPQIISLQKIVKSTKYGCIFYPSGNNRMNILGANSKITGRFSCIYHRFSHINRVFCRSKSTTDNLKSFVGHPIIFSWGTFA